MNKKCSKAEQWWHMPLVPALRRQRQRQEDLCEFEVNVIYRVSSRTARATQRNPVLKNKQCSGYMRKDQVFGADP